MVKVEKYGPYMKFFPYANRDLNESFNSSAWDIFQYSSDTSQLEKALEWSKRTVDGNLQPDPRYLDTHANLLYKLGRTAEAIPYKENAASIKSFG